MFQSKSHKNSILRLRHCNLSPMQYLLWACKLNMEFLHNCMIWHLYQQAMRSRRENNLALQSVPSIAESLVRSNWSVRWNPVSGGSMTWTRAPYAPFTASNAPKGNPPENTVSGGGGGNAIERIMCWGSFADAYIQMIEMFCLTFKKMAWAVQENNFLLQINKRWIIYANNHCIYKYCCIVRLHRN